MKKILLILIILLAFFLRFFRYEYFPIAGETADESAWAFLGASLIQTGKPASWSYFTPYDNYILEKKTGAPLVSPALDHPPLFSFLPGFVHSLKSSWNLDPSIKVIRLPMIFLGTLNVLLLYFATKKLFDEKIAFISTLIYATVPSFVFASRLVVAENLLITWLLLALIFLKSTIKQKYLTLTLIGVLAVMTKVSGLFLPASILMIGLMQKDKKLAISGLIGSFLGLLLFSLYGFFYNLALFLAVQLSQAGRDLGLSTFYNRMFLHPTIVAKIFFDGWIFVGIASLFLIFDRVKNKTSYLFLISFFIVYLLLILVTAGERTFHGWYDYVFYPLLAMGAGVIFEDIIAKRKWLLISLIWIFLLPVIRNFLVYLDFYHLLSNFQMRLLVSMGFIPFGFHLMGEFFKSFWLKKMPFILSLVLFTIILGSNILNILSINQEKYWEVDSFYNPVRISE